MDDTSESSLADHIQESPLFQAGFFTSGVYEDEAQHAAPLHGEPEEICQ
ncbi:hypothetical protein ACKWMY_13520 [Serratia sp. J2]